jgi:hypothetical protein
MLEVNQSHLKESTALLKQFSETSRAVYGNHAYTTGFYEAMLARLVSTYLGEAAFRSFIDDVDEINKRHLVDLLSKKETRS